MLKFFLILSISFFMACSPLTSNDAGGGGAVGRETAPAFTLDAYPAGKVSLSDFKGKVVYLNFIGYNCPPCIASALAIQSEIADKYDSARLQVLALDVWDGSAGGVANYQIQTGVKYTLLMKASTVGTAYDAVNDYSVLVDKKGQIAYADFGVNIAAIKDKIDQLIKE